MANEVKVDVSALERLSKKFAVFPQDLQRIMEATAKDTQRYVGNRIEKDIPKHFAITPGQVKDSLRNKKRRRIVRTLNGAEMRFTVVGERLNLIRFYHRTWQLPSYFLPLARRNSYEVSTTIYRSRGEKMMRPIHGEDGRLKRVFLLPLKDKPDSYIFARRTGGRTKTGKEEIQGIKGMGINQMLESAPVWDKLNKDLQKYADKKIQSQVDKDMERIKKEIEAWR